jgi:hypothetical protein
MRKITVALNLPKGDNELIFAAKHIADGMDGNPYFPSPPLPIATLRAHIAALELAQVATLTRAHGTPAARDERRVIVEEDLKVERLYVETLANQDLVHGPAIVASAGMYIKDARGPGRAELAAKDGPEPGSVQLSVKRPKGAASVHWQWSLDGVQWVDAGESKQADFVVRNLIPTTLYWFRHRFLLASGLTDWGQPITHRAP